MAKIIKHLAIFSLIFIVAFALDTTQDIVIQGEMKTGGYQRVKTQQLMAMLEDPEFKRAEQEARQQYLRVNGNSLGEVIEVHTQIVSGVNYKIKFQTSSDSEPIEIVVWVQPWEDKFTVTGINGFKL